MRSALCPALFLVATLVLAVRPAGAAGLVVDLKNDELRSISVRAGSDNGITVESDFEVLVAADQTVPVFPAEIFKDRFWSAPLSPEDFDSIATGAPVRPFVAEKTTHKLMRRIAGEYAKQIDLEKAASRRWEQVKKVADLKERRSGLQAQKEKIEGWIADTRRNIADGKESANRRNDGAEQDIARAQQRIGDLTDQRNELQAQRDALPQKDRGGGARLTEQIRGLNNRISSERDTIRRANEQKIESRTFGARDVRDRQTLSADRDALEVEIRSLDRQIADLSPGGTKGK